MITIDLSTAHLAHGIATPEIPVDTTIRIMQTQEFGSSQNRTTRTILAGGEELRRLLDGQTSA